MLHKLYKIFIEPRQQDEDLRNREIVLNVLLAGTTVIFSLALILLLISFSLGYTYVSTRILGVFISLVFITGIYQTARAAQYELSANLLLLVYLGMATVVAVRWGVTMP